MKSKIYLLLTIALSLCVFSSRVEAGTVMYMECNNMNDIGNASFYDVVARTFRVDGSPESVFYGIDNSNIYLFSIPVSDNCWIDEELKVDDSCAIGKNADAKKFILNDKTCPGTIRKSTDILQNYRSRYDKEQDKRLILAGDSTPSNISEINEDEYIFYWIYSEKKEYNIIVAEGYRASDGRYFYVNRNFNLGWFEGYGGLTTPAVLDNWYENKYIYEVMYNCKNNGLNYSDFWKVSTNFYALYPSVSGYCSDENDCKDNKNYKVIVSSADDSPIYNIVENEWYSKYANISEDTKMKEFLDLINDERFISSCNSLINSFERGFNYTFSDGYNASVMLEKLSIAYEYLKYAYDFEPLYYDPFTGKNDVELYTSAERTVFYKLFGREKFDEILVEKDNINYILNYVDSSDQIPLETMLINHIDKVVDKVIASHTGSSGVIDINSLYNNDNKKLNEYNELFLKSISYFNQIADSTDLTSEEREQLSLLKDNMTRFGKEHGISVVVNCEDLISEELNKKILSYFNIVRIAVPILLIGLGIFDFVKALFANDDAEMKKAQQKFIKRIIIAILFFFIPILVNFILYITNSVWNIINPDTCIKF